MQRSDNPQDGNRIERGARGVHAGFLDFHHEFNSITRRATRRFQERDWRGCEADAVERLNVYTKVVDRTIAALRSGLGAATDDASLWAQIKRAYGRRVEDRPNAEIAETFFNSVTRRIFGTEGVDQAIEYTLSGSTLPEHEPADRLVARYLFEPPLVRLIERVLQDYRFDAPHRDLSADARRVAARVSEVLGEAGPGEGPEALEVLRPVFYRMKHAYIVGRLRFRTRFVPFILPLLHDDRGVFVDAVLLDESQASILFSFTRAYFHVEAEHPRDLVIFLRSILPRKPVAELYLSLGFHKHGKTELYRSLKFHLDHSSDRFEFASGDRGMVMIVFTLPHFDLVLKVIRDRFAYPKHTTPQEVRDRYRLVFERDRVGRLVEAQEFEHLKFRKELFCDDLLRDLVENAGSKIRIDETHVTIDRVYTERKVRPLNLYLREHDEPAVLAAVVDYGASIKELAMANIFPGDFLLKNFGVTRHGRVVFYDYDELCLLTDCNFRDLPPPRTPEDELSDEPWFKVGENDVFPEEFRRFLGLPEPLLAAFEQHHGELFTSSFWLGLQERHRRGEILDSFPYPPAERLGPAGPDGGP